MFDDDELPPMMEGMLGSTGNDDVPDPSLCVRARVRYIDPDDITVLDLNGHEFAFTPRQLGELLTGLTEAAIDNGVEVEGHDLSNLREEMPVDLAERLRDFHDEMGSDDDDDDDDDEFTSVQL